MKAVLYTSTKCPKCPVFRRLLREAAKELNLVEGRDFIEKLIDGDKVAAGSKVKLEGQDYSIVDKPEDIKETPAALGGQDYMLEALMHQVASTPALVVDDELAFVGSIPEKKELMDRLRGKR